MFPNNMVLMSTNLARSVAHVKCLIYTHKDGGNVYEDVKNEGYMKLGSVWKEIEYECKKEKPEKKTD